VNEGNLRDVKREASRHFWKKIKKYLKAKLTSMNQTVRIRASEICVRAKMNLRRVTILELTWQKRGEDVPAHPHKILNR
jgi:hypothetical protein